MHHFPTPAVVAVACDLHSNTDLGHYDDHEAALRLGLHRKTVASALAELKRMGAISLTSLPSGPRRRRSGPPTRTLSLHRSHWIWLAVEQRGGVS